jgi:hypothetical protein
MHTVFSHIVQKRFSQVNEDVATDALAFILHSSESARNGMMKLLRGVVADLPDLQFRTQQTEGSIRPDMWGFDGPDVRVFVENKFWAGLTDNQPVNYLKQLAEGTESTVLLVVVPTEREQTVWRELIRRLEEGGISVAERETASGVVHSVTTGAGPILALTSWEKLLSILALEAADDQSAKSDLFQLRALCDAAESQAFVPLTSAEISDQRVPRLLLQLGTIIQSAADLAVTEGVLSLKDLRPQASWDRFGRYIRFNDEKGVGAWVGVRHDLWRQHGTTPLWLFFYPGEFSRALEVRSLLEPWAAKEGVLPVFENGEVSIGLDLVAGEEKDLVVRSLVDRLKEIADLLAVLPNNIGIASDGQ